VYSYNGNTDHHNITVAGARNGGVGIAGFLLQDGISFYAPRRGLGCDDVVNFEVSVNNRSGMENFLTLLSGRPCVRKSHQRQCQFNSGLWKALKGGGNRFGVITRVDMTTFDQGDLFGGFPDREIESKAEVIEDLGALASDPNYDIYASIIAGFTYVSALNA